MRSGALLAFTLGGLLLCACGQPGKARRCGADGDCAADQRCDKPVASEQGVCVARSSADGGPDGGADGGPDAGVPCNGLCVSPQVCGDDDVTCVGPYAALSITAPSAGALVGGAGVAVTAKLALGGARANAPLTLGLSAGGVAAGTLARSAQSGLDVTYTGRYTPVTNVDQAVALMATADPGQPTELASSPVSVTVDTAPPSVTNVQVSCPSPCLRDSTLTVSATVTDTHPGTASAQLDLGGAPVAMDCSASPCTASVPLSQAPFPYFAHGVSASVSATDALGNGPASAVAGSSVTATRLRWSVAVDPTAVPQPQLTGAAIDGSGDAIVGASDAHVYFVDLTGAVTHSPLVGGGAITAAPSVGPSAIWVGSNDGKVYAVKLDGSGLVPGTPCDTTGTVTAPPAVGTGNPETVFVPSQSGSVYAVTLAGCRAGIGLTRIDAAAAIDDSVAPTFIYVATTAGKLHQLTFDGTSWTDKWAPAPTVGVGIQAPLALTAGGELLTAAQDTGSTLTKTNSNGTLGWNKALGALAADSAVVLASGDVVVGDQSNNLYRFDSTGAAVAGWSPPAFAGAPFAPVVLTGGDAAFALGTSDGKVWALKADGTALWSGQLSGTNKALTEANVFTPAGQSGQVVSTAYFGSADGTLYAVVVDGALDINSPWPKSHHDIRNTGNAASPLP